jgi:hypothetical protein
MKASPSGTNKIFIWCPHTRPKQTRNWRIRKLYSEQCVGPPNHKVLLHKQRMGFVRDGATHLSYFGVTFDNALSYAMGSSNARSHSARNAANRKTAAVCRDRRSRNYDGRDGIFLFRFRQDPRLEEGTLVLCASSSSARTATLLLHRLFKVELVYVQPSSQWAWIEVI